MKFILVIIMIPLLLVMVSSSTTAVWVWATNEGSYMYGYWQGSLTGPQIAPGANWNPEFDNNLCTISRSSTLNNGMVLPAVTNTTACINGWFSGWKDWCSNHAVDCVENITLGDFPNMILQSHKEYLRGYNAANGSDSMCPIGENAAFCRGWDSRPIWGYNT
jgi:hypothetical protein